MRGWWRHSGKIKCVKNTIKESVRTLLSLPIVISRLFRLFFLSMRKPRRHSGKKHWYGLGVLVPTSKELGKDDILGRLYFSPDYDCYLVQEFRIRITSSRQIIMKRQGTSISVKSIQHTRRYYPCILLCRVL